MDRRFRILSATLLVLCVVPAALAKTRPNIVLVMVDDMGFSDIGCYGGEIRTPNIDALAADGVRFTQFYNTARRCPTRAALMTGLYPHMAGVGWMMADLGHDGYRGDLNRHCVTIAEVLGSSGYSTYMAGKWHVTKFTGGQGPKHNWPRQRGFQRFYGTITGAGSFFTPDTLTLENDRLHDYPDGFYYTDVISDTTVDYITRHRKKSPDKPFFCYVAHTAPHWPLHAVADDIERYRGNYLEGWDRLRADRHRRQMELGVVDSAWPLTPRDPQAAVWDDLPEEKKQELDLRMAIYAAQIDRVDQGIGRIVQTLRETGALENTVIFFLADNGGCAEGGKFGFERKRGGKLGTDSSFASYGRSWANASNTPFREFKHWVHEGGIASPLVVHWPSGMTARNELQHQPAHVIDIMATCLDISGSVYPDTFAGRKIKPLQGRSLAPAFDSDEPIDRDGEGLYWEHEGNRAVRLGDWKLVAKGKQGPWELYNLRRDRTETDNLASSDPERVQQLSDLWQRYAARCDVLPVYPREQKPK